MRLYIRGRKIGWHYLIRQTIRPNGHFQPPSYYPVRVLHRTRAITPSQIVRIDAAAEQGRDVDEYLGAARIVLNESEAAIWPPSFQFSCRHIYAADRAAWYSAALL